MEYKFFTNCADAMAFIGLKPTAEMQQVEAVYPVCLNKYYLSLIDPENFENDPIALQAFPRKEELDDQSSSFDPLAEEEQMPVPRMIHRYPDRVVILTTGACAMRCRFCFRKREWANGNNLKHISLKEVNKIVKYLNLHTEVHDVLLSGGDPLMLSPALLLKIIRKIREVPTIDTIRICTRMPVVNPDFVGSSMYGRLLADIPGVWVVTHFNHPREVTPQSMAACARLSRWGVPILNQSVLLKGVNDNADILEELFRKLVAHRIKPHYLFHVDPVRGVRHFATGIECGLDILRQFRTRLSSLAVPTFAIDLPSGGGKVNLQPEYKVDGLFPDIHHQRLIRYEETLEKRD